MSNSTHGDGSFKVVSLRFVVEMQHVFFCCRKLSSSLVIGVFAEVWHRSDHAFLRALERAKWSTEWYCSIGRLCASMSTCVSVCVSHCLQTTV